MPNNHMDFAVDLLPNSITMQYSLGNSTNKWKINGVENPSLTDTTYSAEKGISLNTSTNKFGHSNSEITAQTTQAIYPIAIDAYGHITSYGTAIEPLVTHANNYGKITPANNTTTVTALTGNTTAVEASSSHENLKFTATNKWIVVAGSNSSIAGSDELKIAHLVPSSIANSGPTSNQTGTRGSTFNIPKLTIDEAGHITEISSITVSLPTSDNTDEKVKQTENSSSSNYKILFTTSSSPTSGNAANTYYGTNFTYNPSTKTLTNGTASLKSETSTTANTAAYDVFTLGNSTNVTSTSAHSEGKIVIYSAATQTHTIIGKSTTTAYSHTLPNKDGLLVTNGKTDGTAVGDTYQPIYIDSSGVTTVCSISDSSSASAISTNQKLVTERDIYYGLPTINNGHDYTSSTKIYAPISAGTANQILVSSGSNLTPTWLSTAAGAAYADSSNGVLTFGTLTEEYGGTGQTTYTIGDILYCGTANSLSKLNGNTTTTRKFLRSVATTSGTAVAPAWDTVTKTDVGLSNVTNDTQVKASLGTTKGDMLYWSTSSTPERLAIGTAGYFLKATANGPAWANTTDITAVGTITTGTWQGTAIASDYIGSHTHSYLPLSGGTLTGALTGTSLTLSSSLTMAANQEFSAGGSIEMHPSASASHGGFIDFHYNNSAEDYTTRIIESSARTLTIKALTGARGYLNLVAESDHQFDLGFGRSGTIKWALSSRTSSEAFFGLYNHVKGAWSIQVAESDHTVTLAKALPVGSGGTGVTAIANIQAGKDGDGNTISSTYLKLSGGTLTGNLTVGQASDTTERQIMAYSAAGRIYLRSEGSSTGVRGIYSYNAAGTGVTVLNLNQNNQISTMAPLANRLQFIISNNNYSSAPSADTSANIAQVLDNNNYIRHNIYAYRPTTNSYYTIMAARYPTNETTNVVSNLGVGITKDGDATYMISHPVVFRNILGASSGVWPVSLGGTGATDAAGARTNLGAVAKTGDTMTGDLTLPHLNVQSGGRYTNIHMRDSNGVPRGLIWSDGQSGRIFFRSIHPDVPSGQVGSIYTEYYLYQSSITSGDPASYKIYSERDTIPVNHGGTGATTAIGAKAALGLGTTTNALTAKSNFGGTTQVFGLSFVVDNSNNTAKNGHSMSVIFQTNGLNIYDHTDGESIYNTAQYISLTSSTASTLLSTLKKIPDGTTAVATITSSAFNVLTGRSGSFTAFRNALVSRDGNTYYFTSASAAGYIWQWSISNWTSGNPTTGNLYRFEGTQVT